MKTFEARARDLAANMTATAKMMVPTALIDLLIDICKTLDQLNQEKKP